MAEPPQTVERGAPAGGQPVGVTVFFSAEGRCYPAVLVLDGESLPVVAILHEGREGQRWIWVVRVAGGLRVELVFDPQELRWVARRTEAEV